MKKLVHLLIAAMGLSFQRPLTAANVGAGTHSDGNITLLADAALSDTNLRVKFGTDANHFAVAGAEAALGICADDPDTAENPHVVQLLGASKGTKLGVGSGVIAAGDYVVGDTAGRFKTLPSSNGTYYVEGRAITASAADGDEFEVETCTPYPVTIST